MFFNILDILLQNKLQTQQTGFHTSVACVQMERSCFSEHIVHRFILHT